MHLSNVSGGPGPTLGPGYTLGHLPAAFSQGVETQTLTAIYDILRADGGMSTNRFCSRRGDYSTMYGNTGAGKALRRE